jgi:hypothetical protein
MLGAILLILLILVLTGRALNEGLVEASALMARPIR